MVERGLFLVYRGRWHVPAVDIVSRQDLEIEVEGKRKQFLAKNSFLWKILLLASSLGGARFVSVEIPIRRWSSNRSSVAGNAPNRAVRIIHEIMLAAV